MFLRRRVVVMYCFFRRRADVFLSSVSRPQILQNDASINFKDFFLLMFVRKEATSSSRKNIFFSGGWHCFFSDETTSLLVEREDMCLFGHEDKCSR